MTALEISVFFTSDLDYPFISSNEITTSWFFTPTLKFPSWIIWNYEIFGGVL